ncbi:unnamed protein product [Lampetra planeri]
MDSLDEETIGDISEETNGVKHGVSALQHLQKRQKKLLDEVQMLAKRSQVFQEFLAPDVPKETTDNKDVREKIIMDCESVWREVNEMQARICMQEATPVSPENPILDILLAKKWLLNAEVEISTETKQLMPLKYPECALVVAEEKLKQVIGQLEETLSFYRTTTKALESELERERAYLEDQKKIQQALKEKLAQLATDTANTSSSQDLPREMQERLRKAMLHYKKLNKALFEFSNEFFPLPTENGVHGKRKKKSTNVNSTKNIDYIAIHEILELLMNQMTSSPHDPYITVQDNFWPPFVEKLLRFDMAVTHPEDHNKIRIQFYHE